jgi:hypothetical protein
MSDLDGNETRAYASGVVGSGHLLTEPAASAAAQAATHHGSTPRRRRTLSPAERKRVDAWGRKWGEIMRQAWRTAQREREP